MDSVKYIGMDVHKEAIAIAVLNSSGKLVMECVIETKAITILDFPKGLRGSSWSFFASTTAAVMGGNFIMAFSFFRLAVSWVLRHTRFDELARPLLATGPDGVGGSDQPGI